VVVFAAAAASSSSKGQDDASEVVVSSGSMYNSNKDGGSIPVSDAHSNRGEIDPATPNSMGRIWNLFTNNVVS